MCYVLQVTLQMLRTSVVLLFLFKPLFVCLFCFLFFRLFPISLGAFTAYFLLLFVSCD